MRNLSRRMSGKNHGLCHCPQRTDKRRRLPESMDPRPRTAGSFELRRHLPGTDARFGHQGQLMSQQVAQRHFDGIGQSLKFVEFVGRERPFGRDPRGLTR